MDVLKNADEDTGLDEEDRITKPIPPVHFYPLEVSNAFWRL
jgi:hypothetical protein